MILTQHGINSISLGGGDEPTEVEIGGKTYPVVKIGNQYWMAENLDYQFDGCAIAPTSKPYTAGAWYWQNDESTYGYGGKKYGLMYNGHAMMALVNNKDTLIPGWHVPTQSDFDELVTTAGGTNSAGIALKSTDYWTSSTMSGGGNGTDAFGFNGLPTGYVYWSSSTTVAFSSEFKYAYFWSSTKRSASFSYTYYMKLTYWTGECTTSSEAYFPDYGIPIRLVKDT